MIAEILATGEEIRSGALVDSNSAHIAQKLEEAGIQVVRHHCVGDDLNLLALVLKEIASRSDIAVVTGGLGPTVDDLTAEAAAKAAGVVLSLDRVALKSMENFFTVRKRTMSISAKKQAKLPKGAACLCNPVGTAPGFILKIERCLFFFLPGVPHEMQRMLSDGVLPRILDDQGSNRNFCLVKTVSVFGLTESATNELLAGFEKTFPDIRLGLRAKFPEIQVKLYTGGKKDERSLKTRLATATGWVVEKIGNKVFSENGDSMERIVGTLLSRKKATLAVAESCTGGLIAHMLTNVPGSSDYFLFSGVTYSNQAKEAVLEVLPATLKKFGAVHEETAKEMAEGARRLCSATYGLSTSGIAGPDGGTSAKPVGTVCIGLASDHSQFAQRFTFTNYGRLMNKQIFAMTGLDLLRRELLGI
jgi:nicotinamide-nucleotide amidase